MKDKLKQVLVSLGRVTYGTMRDDENLRYAATLIGELIDAPEPPQREPLSDDRIKHIAIEAGCDLAVDDSELIVRLVRGVERELGVK